MTDPSDPPPSPPEKVSLAAAAARLEGPWRPRVLARANGQELKLARLEGPFVWHRHADADEAFLAVEGSFRIEFRGAGDEPESVRLGPGELVVVPKGVEHRPVADEPALVVLFEPEGVRNTGDVVDARLTAPVEDAASGESYAPPGTPRGR